MNKARVEVVFEPRARAVSRVFSPDLPDMVSQGDTLEEATANAEEPSPFTSKACEIGARTLLRE
jgi:hypothetical protein